MLYETRTNKVSFVLNVLHLHLIRYYFVLYITRQDGEKLLYTEIY
jgi:hypothetical protein